MEQLERIRDFGRDRSKFVRLDKNERTIPFEERIIQGMLASLTPADLPAYPDQTQFYRKLARHLDVKEVQLLLTPGSDAAIKMLYETYVEEGDEVIFLDPTYAMIPVYCELFGGVPRPIKYSDGVKLDFTALLSAITPATRMVIIANPNQPTGTVLEQKEMCQLVDKTLECNTLLVVDEAYIHFSGAKSALHLIGDYDHVVVTQTFSKGIGLASVRLGFIASNPVNIDHLLKVKTLSDINLFAIKCGEYLLDHYDVVQSYIDDVMKARVWLKREFVKHDIEMIDTQSNFVHLRLPPKVDTAKLVAAMQKAGYLVRTTGSGLPAVLVGCIRITVGPIEQMRAFVLRLVQEIS